MTRVEEKLQEWRRILAAHGIRMTPQREAVLHYLAQARTHPTAAEVYREVKHRAPRVSRATVYNTLNLLTRLGLIVELRRQDGAVRYETNLDPHVNLICIRCGQVFDVETPISLSLPDTIPFSVRHIRVDAYGLCAQCRAASSTPDSTSIQQEVRNT